MDDPEYPGISVVDMGMIEDVTVRDGHAQVRLIPTFSGCPALRVIESDIVTAIGEVPGVHTVEVLRSATPWHTGRLSARARQAMAQEFTVAVAPPPVTLQLTKHDRKQRRNNSAVASTDLSSAGGSVAQLREHSGGTASPSGEQTAAVTTPVGEHLGGRQPMAAWEGGAAAAPACPLCGGGLVEQSAFGPVRCRSVWRCEACAEVVEVMRT